MRFSICILLALCFYKGRAQLVLNTDTIGSRTVSDNVYNKQLFGDSLSTSFCIVIKKGVKAHKHLYHSEHVLVLEGEGVMRLADSSFTLKKGDLIFIPKNTIHAVKTNSKVPLKVLSIQSPLFNGSDRVFVEKK
jgi:mannose-6-phosphate isomerase-like protein (cupin superfamily)